MGRTPTKRSTEGAILIRLTAEEYNLAYDEIITKRHSSFQKHVRNALLAPNNNRMMINILETVLAEAKMSTSLTETVKKFLKELKGTR
jgi:hypothetical protein